MTFEFDYSTDRALEVANAWCTFWQEFAWQANRWDSSEGYRRAQGMWKEWYEIARLIECRASSLFGITRSLGQLQLINALKAGYCRKPPATDIEGICAYLFCNPKDRVLFDIYRCC